jgi:hypothetical protein
MTGATVVAEMSTAIKATSNNHTTRWNQQQPLNQSATWTFRVQGYRPRAKHKWTIQKPLVAQSILNITLTQQRPHDARDALQGNANRYLISAGRRKPAKQKQHINRKINETWKVQNTVQTVNNTPAKQLMLTSAAISDLDKKVVSATRLCPQTKS